MCNSGCVCIQYVSQVICEANSQQGCWYSGLWALVSCESRLEAYDLEAVSIPCVNIFLVPKKNIYIYMIYTIMRVCKKLLRHTRASDQLFEVLPWWWDDGNEERRSDCAVSGRACWHAGVFMVGDWDVWIPPLPHLGNIHTGTIALSVCWRNVVLPHILPVFEKAGNVSGLHGEECTVHIPLFDISRKMSDKGMHLPYVTVQFLNTCSFQLHLSSLHYVYDIYDESPQMTCCCLLIMPLTPIGFMSSFDNPIKSTELSSYETDSSP